MFTLWPKVIYFSQLLYDIGTVIHTLLKKERKKEKDEMKK